MICDKCEYNGMKDIWVHTVLCTHPKSKNLNDMCIGHIFEKKDMQKNKKCPFIVEDFIKENEFSVNI